MTPGFLFCTKMHLCKTCNWGCIILVALDNLERSYWYKFRIDNCVPFIYEFFSDQNYVSDLVTVFEAVRHDTSIIHYY